MDKSWIHWNRNSPEYQEKAKEFILNSKKYARNPDKVLCPCVLCGNCSPQFDETLLLHLTRYGFDPSYKVWVAHGEPFRPATCAQVDDCATPPHIGVDSDEDFEMLELHQMYEDARFQFETEGETPSYTNIEDKYKKKIIEAEVPLYPGCTKYTKLSATLDMYKLKAESGLTNEGFNGFMKAFKDMLPGINEKSKKMKIIRGRQLLPHTLSRNGYARYEYDWNRKNPGRRLCRSGLYIKGHEQKIIKNVPMAETINRIQENLDAQPPNEGPIPVKYDALSQVLGNERPGRVRGLGAGVTPSRVDAQLQSASWRQDLEQRLQANSERTRILEDIIFNWSQSATGGGNGHGGNSDDGSKRTSNPAKSAQDGPENGEARTNSSPQTGTSKSVQGGTLCVNDQCELLDWDGTGPVVARGKISATDPTTKVHGYKLGPDCYRVAVEEAVVPRAEFFRYQPEFSAMEDAVGSTIAWPTKYIVPL